MALGWSLSGRRTLGDSSQRTMVQIALANLGVAKAWLLAAIKVIQSDGGIVDGIFCKPEIANNLTRKLKLIQLAILAFKRACAIYAAEEGFGPPPGSSAWKKLPEAVILLSQLVVAVAQRIAGARWSEGALDVWGYPTNSNAERDSLDDPAAVERRLKSFDNVGPGSWQDIIDAIDREWAAISASYRRESLAAAIFAVWDLILALGAGSLMEAPTVTRYSPRMEGHFESGDPKIRPLERPFEKPIDREPAGDMGTGKRPGGGEPEIGGSPPKPPPRADLIDRLEAWARDATPAEREDARNLRTQYHTRVEKEVGDLQDALRRQGVGLDDYAEKSFNARQGLRSAEREYVPKELRPAFDASDARTPTSFEGMVSKVMRDQGGTREQALRTIAEKARTGFNKNVDDVIFGR